MDCHSQLNPVEYPPVSGVSVVREVEGGGRSGAWLWVVYDYFIFMYACMYVYVCMLACIFVFVETAHAPESMNQS